MLSRRRLGAGLASSCRCSKCVASALYGKAGNCLPEVVEARVVSLRGVCRVVVPAGQRESVAYLIYW